MSILAWLLPFSIDWGNFKDHFDVWGEHLGTYRNPNFGGHSEHTLLCSIQTKHSMYVVTGEVHCYDSNGIEAVPFGMVEFIPYFGMWRTGQRARAQILLGSDLRHIKKVVISCFVI